MCLRAARAKPAMVAPVVQAARAERATNCQLLSPETSQTLPKANSLILPAVAVEAEKAATVEATTAPETAEMVARAARAALPQHQEDRKL